MHFGWLIFILGPGACKLPEMARGAPSASVKHATARTKLECPLSVARHVPASGSHTRSVLSYEAETARKEPSASVTIATLVT